MLKQLRCRQGSMAHGRCSPRRCARSWPWCSLNRTAAALGLSPELVKQRLLEALDQLSTYPGPTFALRLPITVSAAWTSVDGLLLTFPVVLSRTNAHRASSTG
jgi:hypothetical protein